VILGVRNIEAAKKSVEMHVERSLIIKKVDYEQCDTADINSVKSFAKKVRERHQKIHLLVRNY
jgi:NAD(P)-dependent dehydrogenase (short-subunit alcohol dehydrogenase family)